MFRAATSVATPPTCYRSLSGRAREVSRECPRRCPRKRLCPREFGSKQKGTAEQVAPRVSSLKIRRFRVYVFPLIPWRKYDSQRPLFGGDFLGQILAAPSLPGAFVYSRGVFEGVSPAPFEPWAPECPRSVSTVSPECQKGVWETPKGVRDTPGTLFGHSGERGAKDPCSTPPRTSKFPSQTIFFV